MGILIISDDLTGANDTAVQFFKKDIETRVFFDYKDAVAATTGVSVINAETRALPPLEANKKIEEICHAVNWDKQSLTYKKIDSTMRGNIGAEIDALLDNGPFDTAVVVPAYPENGRVTIGGYHLIHGKLLEDTEIANDPKSPVTESFLPSLLRDQSKYAVSHIDIKAIRSNRLVQQFQDEMEKEKQIFVVDSSSVHDMALIVKPLMEQNKRILWVGSAGLAQAVSEHLDESNHPQAKEPSENAKEESMPTLVVAGSLSEVTRRQIKFLSENDFFVIDIDPVQLLDTNYQQFVLGWVEKATNVLLSGCHLVITTKNDKETVDQLNRLKANQSLSSLEIGNRIAERLGLIGAQLAANNRISGLVLTGGDIAFHACNQLNIRGLTLVDEVEEGIPLCEVAGGNLSSLKVVTKAGAFGKDQSLYHAVQVINGSADGKE